MKLKLRNIDHGYIFATKLMCSRCLTKLPNILEYNFTYPVDLPSAQLHSVHPPFLLKEGGGGRSSTLRGGLLEKWGVTFFFQGGGGGKGGCNFF